MQCRGGGILNFGATFSRFRRYVTLSDAEAFSAALERRGILVNPPEGGDLRLVTHYWIKAERIPVIVSAVAEAAAEAGAKAGGRA